MDYSFSTFHIEARMQKTTSSVPFSKGILNLTILTQQRRFRVEKNFPEKNYLNNKNHAQIFFLELRGFSNIQKELVSEGNHNTTA